MNGLHRTAANCGPITGCCFSTDTLTVCALANNTLLAWHSIDAYLETTYITDPTNQGALFNAEIPKHTFKFWSTYNFQDGLLKNFRLGLGTIAVSEANRGAEAQKGYAVFNGQAGYAFEGKWSVSLTVNNLFDKVYYVRIPSNYYGIYGDPRNAMLTLRKSF